jgi:hypothetical protein
MMKVNLDVLHKEADKLISNTLGTDWLAAAEKAKISQTEFIEAPETVCYLNHKLGKYTLFTRGSISTITGKAKAGKTSALAVLIASVLADKKVLWIDTEQGKYYGSKTQHYVLSAAGLTISDNFLMYDLRPNRPEERVAMMDALLKSAKFDLVIIDGVRDLIFDINNPEEATVIITQLMKWSVEYNCHICMVLHQNKGNNDVRGHLGTEAINKSEAVLSVNKIDGELGTSVVASELSRGLPFPDFFISRKESGIPFINAQFIQPQKIAGKKKLGDPVDFPDERHIEVLNLVFKRSAELTSGECISAICSAWSSNGGDSMSQTRAKTFKSYYEQRGMIITQKNQKGNRTMNILNETYRVGSLVDQLFYPTVQS